MKIRLFLLLSAAALLLTACGGDGSEKAGTAPSAISLTAEQGGNYSEDNPASEVYLLIDNEKVKIASAQNCQPMPESAYEDYDVPGEALNALSCYFAGTGNYYFLEETDEGYVVYEGILAEQDTTGEVVYSPVALYDGDLQFDLMPSVDDIVGTYTRSRQEGSDILFVGLHEDTLIAEHFQTDGILPPTNQLNMLMTGLTPIDSAGLDLKRPSMEFTSTMGSGQFIRSREGLEAWLYPDGEQSVIRMQKILPDDYSIPVQ